METKYGHYATRIRPTYVLINFLP